MFSKMSFSVFRVLRPTNCVLQCRVAGYKSQYSLDKIHPNSNPDYSGNLPSKHTQADDESFSGFIPMDDLEFRYSRSSGPGGQNVNKVNTKVEVRFHVQSAKWIPEFAKPKLLAEEHTRITKDGFLVVRSDKTRKQLLNQADCLEKIRSLVWTSCKQPRLPTEQEIQLMEKRKAKAKEGVLREKRSTSLKKQHRGGPGMGAL